MLSLAKEIQEMEWMPLHLLSLVFEGKEIWSSELGEENEEMDRRTVGFVSIMATIGLISLIKVVVWSARGCPGALDSRGLKGASRR